MRRAAPLVLLLGLTLGTVVHAQDDLSGTYSLKAREGWFGSKITTRLTLSKTDTGYDVERLVSYDGSDDKVGPIFGSAVVDATRSKWTRLKVTFPEVRGVATALENALGGRTVGTWPNLDGTYKIYKKGKVKGWVKSPNRAGEVVQIVESGYSDVDPTTVGDENAKPVSNNVHIEGPSGKVVLTGQSVTYSVRPEDAVLTVLAGSAEVTAGGIKVTAPGLVRLQAQKGEEGSQVVALEAVAAEVLEVTVLDTIELEDAPPPHYKRKLGQKSDAGWQPAVILMNQPLRLSVKIGASKSLSEATEVTLKARGDGGLSFEAKVSLLDLKSGQSVEVSSSGAFSDEINVHQVELDWSYEGAGSQDLNGTDLRLYTTLRAPVDNPMPRYAPSSRQGKPLKTKLHFELACSWAAGRSTNSGNDAESICHRADNHLSHLAWGEDHRAAQKVPHYAEGAKAPKNYDDLRGSISNGLRGVAGLYYPPLEPTKGYQEYHHYRNNFGWWVLENDSFVGGRCNQQASLICDVFGTLGIRAEVYYIERTARGPSTGRPMRRYYKSSRSDKSWNFHGQAMAYLDNDTEWLYDGSGSWPPNRINGKVGDLMKVPNGPYVDYWNPWRYEDGYREAVPASDVPHTWRGVPLQPGEEAPVSTAPRPTGG